MRTSTCGTGGRPARSSSLKLVKPKLRTRIEDRMLRHKAVEAALRLFGQRVIGRPLVGKFGMAAYRRNGARIEQRRQRRQPLERRVGVPQPVAQLEHALPRILAPHFVFRIEIGDVGEFLAHAQLGILAMQRDRGLERPEVPREVEVLVLRQMLVGKDQHRIFGEGVLDRLQVWRRERRRQIDIADLGGKIWRDRTDGDGHGRASRLREFCRIESQWPSPCN